MMVFFMVMFDVNLDIQHGKRTDFLFRISLKGTFFIRIINGAGSEKLSCNFFLILKKNEMRPILLFLLFSLAIGTAKALIIITFPSAIPDKCFVALYDDFYNPIASGLINCGGLLVPDGKYDINKESDFIRDLQKKNPKLSFEEATVRSVSEAEFLSDSRYQKDQCVHSGDLPAKSLSEIIVVTPEPAGILVAVGCHYGVTTAVTFDDSGYHFHEFHSIPCSGNWAVSFYSPPPGDGTGTEQAGNELYKEEELQAGISIFSSDVIPEEVYSSRDPDEKYKEFLSLIDYSLPPAVIAAEKLSDPWYKRIITMKENPGLATGGSQGTVLCSYECDYEGYRIEVIEEPGGARRIRSWTKNIEYYAGLGEIIQDFGNVSPDYNTCGGCSVTQVWNGQGVSPFCNRSGQPISGPAYHVSILNDISYDGSTLPLAGFDCSDYDRAALVNVFNLSPNPGFDLPTTCGVACVNVGFQPGGDPSDTIGLGHSWDEWNSDAYHETLWDIWGSFGGAPVQPSSENLENGYGVNLGLTLQRGDYTGFAVKYNYSNLPFTYSVPSGLPDEYRDIAIGLTGDMEISTFSFSVGPIVNLPAGKWNFSARPAIQLFTTKMPELIVAQPDASGQQNLESGLASFGGKTGGWGYDLSLNVNYSIWGPLSVFVEPYFTGFIDPIIHYTERDPLKAYDGVVFSETLFTRLPYENRTISSNLIGVYAGLSVKLFSQDHNSTRSTHSQKMLSGDKGKGDRLQMEIREYWTPIELEKFIDQQLRPENLIVYENGVWIPLDEVTRIPEKMNLTDVMGSISLSEGRSYMYTGSMANELLAAFDQLMSNESGCGEGCIKLSGGCLCVGLNETESEIHSGQDLIIPFTWNSFTDKFIIEKRKKIQKPEDILYASYVFYDGNETYIYDGSYLEIYEILKSSDDSTNGDQEKLSSCPPNGWTGGPCTSKGGFCWCYLKGTDETKISSALDVLNARMIKENLESVTSSYTIASINGDVKGQISVMKGSQLYVGPNIDDVLQAISILETSGYPSCGDSCIKLADGCLCVGITDKNERQVIWR